MKKLTKINQLKKVESFIQFDFVKGYKYVDKAGEIVNYFHKDGVSPKFTMGLDGLVIYEPDSKVKEIKVTPKSFWSHYINPDSLDQAKNLFTKNLDFVNSVILPEGFSRVGWRNYFIHEVSTVEIEKWFKKIVPISDSEFKQLSFIKDFGKISCNITVTPASKNNDPKSPAILIDADIYLESKTSVDLTTAKKQLDDIEAVIKGPDYLEFINNIFIWSK